MKNVKMKIAIFYQLPFLSFFYRKIKSLYWSYQFFSSPFLPFSKKAYTFLNNHDTQTDKILQGFENCKSFDKKHLVIEETVRQLG